MTQPARLLLPVAMAALLCPGCVHAARPSVKRWAPPTPTQIPVNGVAIAATPGQRPHVGGFSGIQSPADNFVYDWLARIGAHPSRAYSARSRVAMLAPMPWILNKDAHRRARKFPPGWPFEPGHVTAVRILLLCPKTHVPPPRRIPTGCSLTITIVWSCHDTVPNQYPSADDPAFWRHYGQVIPVRARTVLGHDLFCRRTHGWPQFIGPLPMVKKVERCNLPSSQNTLGTYYTAWRTTGRTFNATAWVRQYTDPHSPEFLGPHGAVLVAFSQGANILLWALRGAAK